MVNFINSRTGFFNQLHKIKNFLLPIDFHIYTVSYALSTFYPITQANPLSISGADFTEEGAKSRCIGEAIERYCWFYASVWKKLVFASYKDLKLKAVHPSRFALFSEAQYRDKNFPFVPFNENTKIYWIKGRRLNDNKSIYLPAQLCLPIQNIGQNFIAYSTTTGLACARSFSKALFTAISEVIERDAFMIMWLNKLKPILLDINWGDSFFASIFKFLSLSEYQCFVYSLATDIKIPVIMSLLVHKQRKKPLVAFGAASHLDFKKAVKKAVLESLHGLNYLIEEKFSGNSIKWEGTKTRLRNFDEHALLYSEPEMYDKVAFLLTRFSKKMKVRISGEDEDNFDYKKGVNKIVSLIEKAGYEVIVIDLTPLSFKKMGFYVIKVVIPGFIDLGLDRYYFLGGRRIYEIPVKLGLKKTVKKEQELNIFPHPFP